MLFELKMKIKTKLTLFKLTKIVAFAEKLLLCSEKSKFPKELKIYI